MEILPVPPFWFATATVLHGMLPFLRRKSAWEARQATLRLRTGARCPNTGNVLENSGFHGEPRKGGFPEAQKNEVLNWGGFSTAHFARFAGIR